MKIRLSCLMGKLFGNDGGGGEEPVRKTWYGMNQPRPRLPYYFRSSKRLKSLDEFEEPEWKGRVQFVDDGDVTLRGVARETLRWLAIFAIVGTVGGSFWLWLGGSSCVEVIGGFKMGWC